ncbi:hypothetical protein [Murimonas intestini]|uniref:hypothetical protein n=1 Tax=Murimonas intestini TaxID=1337051 RepID=UPI0011DDB421|nr:hypothetical protein [Murimonas intestini]
MTDNELLLAISDMMDKKIEPVTAAIRVMQSDIDTLKQRLESVETRLESVETRLESLETRVESVEAKLESVALKLENETNHNIQLLAENHINLVDKLNQAIRVSDKTLLYEVQVSTLKSKVEYLEKEVAEIKNHIA